LQILAVGGGPGIIAALENGQIDVAFNTSLLRPATYNCGRTGVTSN
jgi:hypothetical protein